MRLFWAVFLPALAYQLLAIAGELKHLARRRRERPGTYTPPVSVLKPLRGLDPNTSEAFRSQLDQNYPRYEILFGVNDENDPAAREVARLVPEYPAVDACTVVSASQAPNGKVAVLVDLGKQARNPIWVVNDSDIRVTPEYLARVVAPLADESVGVVTCLYRAIAHTPAAWWESLGVATDFMPSTLVAQLLGVREFGLGSTLAFRAADLEEAGGFTALSNYLADDYQLAKRITASGKRAVLSTYTVETSFGEATWAGVWQHQLRWARTIRASKGGGYAGLPITHAGLWMIIAAACGAWPPLIALGIVRILSALISTGFVLNDSSHTPFCWLAPVWDLYSFAVWAASYAGRQVHWRDRVLQIDSEGRIVAETRASGAC